LPNLRVSVYCDSGDTVYSVYTAVYIVMIHSPPKT
jgi:hypothetical protein